MTVVLVGASAVASTQGVQADPAGRISAASCGRHGSPYALALARVAVAMHLCRTVHRPVIGTPSAAAAARWTPVPTWPALTHRPVVRPTPTTRTTTPAVTTPSPVVPTDSPSPTPTTSTPSTVPAGSTAAFGSGPSSPAVTCNGKSHVTISGLTFSGIGNDVPAITIRNCSDVTITQNDFLDDAEPIYVVNSTDVTITSNRYRNITGPYQRNGSHRGNFTQWENSTGGAISGNVGIGGNTEDIVSIYKSGGSSASTPLVIENNTFEGTDWVSPSGSGILVGDGGGSHIVVRGNTLINPGQIGIGVSGGSDIHVTGNTVFGQQRTSSNVGIYVWGQGTACSAIEVAGNTVDWKKASGVVSGAWNGGNCGTIAGWASNAFTATIPDVPALHVTL
ncbi:right-handed parallel beta-helix repeat-containing protein [Amnibacterium sp.]|uniref:right-handed parallel beta-helix repeat-containing protein n=1 Tax=Amnibacterium sp. TaxID=1872496 RepID=UPI00261640B3|nr:right-handed parallel beta-helix repeat-containing protein [Amnibacterium sp.]